MLTHKLLITVGLSCDALGAILLGVEAVKLENVRRFREWLDRGGHKVFRAINPEITFVDEPIEHPRVDAALGVVALLGFISMGVIIGGPIVFGLYKLAHHLGTPAFGGHPTWATVLLVIGGVFAALLLATALISGGEWLLDRVLDGIEQLDKHTPTGGVGLVGVFFLVVGFGLQVAATWIE